MNAGHLQGMTEVMANLRREVNQLSERIKKALIQAGHFIQAEAQKRTPVDTGALRAGARTTWESTEFGVRVVVCYQAEYAIFVHERVAQHAVGDWKFLERAVTENWDAILQMIAKESRLR